MVTLLINMRVHGPVILTTGYKTFQFSYMFHIYLEFIYLVVILNFLTVFVRLLNSIRFVYLKILYICVTQRLEDLDAWFNCKYLNGQLRLTVTTYLGSGTNVALFDNRLIDMAYGRY